jgi:hypothetical protein
MLGHVEECQEKELRRKRLRVSQKQKGPLESQEMNEWTKIKTILGKWVLEIWEK